MSITRLELDALYEIAASIDDEVTDLGYQISDLQPEADAAWDAFYEAEMEFIE